KRAAVLFVHAPIKHTRKIALSEKGEIQTPGCFGGMQANGNVDQTEINRAFPDSARAACALRRSSGFCPFRPFSRHRKTLYEIGFLFRVVQAAPLRRLTLVVRPRDSGSWVTCGLCFFRFCVLRDNIL